MKIAIRMDDITPDMDWSKFLRFKELCDLYQVKPLIGVIPVNQDSMLQIDSVREDFWDYLKQLQKEGWVIAQHGYCHIYQTKRMGVFPLNRLSEFAGLKYEEQLHKLQAGREILEAHGIKTDMFMAPAHSYDKNTLQALKATGFKKITDGFGKYPYQWKNLIFFPIAYKQGKSLKQSEGYTTFVVHANTMHEGDFKKFEKMLQDYPDRFISYQELLDVQPKKRSWIGHVQETLLAFGKFILVRINHMLHSGGRKTNGAN